MELPPEAQHMSVCCSTGTSVDATDILPHALESQAMLYSTTADQASLLPLRSAAGPCLTKRLWIGTRQCGATTATFLRLELINLIAFFGRNQLSKMSPMPRLSAPLAGCHLSSRRRRASCCISCCTCSPRRGIRVRCLLIFSQLLFQVCNFRLQLLNSSQQQLHERPHPRRHLGIQFRRYCQSLTHTA